MSGGTGIENDGRGGTEKGRKLGRAAKGGRGGRNGRGRAEEGFTTSNNIRRKLQVSVFLQNEDVVFSILRPCFARLFNCKQNHNPNQPNPVELNPPNSNRYIDHYWCYNYIIGPVAASEVSP